MRGAGEGGGRQVCNFASSIGSSSPHLTLMLPQVCVRQGNCEALMRRGDCNGGAFFSLFILSHFPAFYAFYSYVTVGEVFCFFSSLTFLIYVFCTVTFFSLTVRLFFFLSFLTFQFFYAFLL